MSHALKILMVASENDALPGAKVGGIGDVVRDVPPGLARHGCEVCVVIPAYGALANLPGEQRLGVVEVGFGGVSQHVEFYEVPGRRPHPGVRHVVVDHPQFAACGRGRVYCADPPATPFATDATKFALFCQAVAEALVRGLFGHLDVLHLHDWHAALLLVLRRFHPAFRSLQAMPTVFSIHNLALQGVRPLHGHASSLGTWYPGLSYNHALVADPRWPDCINPMAAGIRLADRVHTVSPSYAEEILQSSAVESRGYYGGEGLEGDLRAARREERLFGILNGCEYPEEPGPAAPSWVELLSLLKTETLRWIAQHEHVPTAHFLALQRLERLLDRERPGLVLTSVGRITDQKVRLLRQPGPDGRPALHGILDALGERGVCLFLGSGDPAYERFIAETGGRFENLVFLNGYSEAVSAALYAAGDLFLMPSSFEPCGISQMLAMRAGQPCLVHHVGGLRDTVRDGVDGFAFTGTNLTEQAGNLVTALRAALDLREHEPKRWKSIGAAAAAARFSWDDSVKDYLKQLYGV